MYAYNQMYLNDAMQNLADAFDVAVRGYNFSLNFYMDLFINSGVANQFEVGNPKYISGKSGIELVEDVIGRTYGKESIKHFEPIYKEPSIEYWTGWVTAYYQWISGKSFRDIQKIITVEEISKKYDPYHEMDEGKLVDFIDNEERKQNSIVRLQAYRKRLGLSQRELAKEAGINLRTLQQYEIGAKDINKAAASTVLALSKVLQCDVKDISK